MTTLCIWIFLASAAIANVAIISKDVKVKSQIENSSRLLKGTAYEQLYAAIDISEKYDYSFILVGVGIALLFVGIVMNAGELMFAKKESHDDGYAMSSKQKVFTWKGKLCVVEQQSCFY